jgi:hypothetical protein
MPLVRYFIWVGSVLLALLFIADAYLPTLPAAKNDGVRLPVIRIYSDRKKWPERVDYDTAAIVPKPPANVEIVTPGSPAITVVSPKTREALAELQTPDGGPPQPVGAKKPEARPQRLHRFAKTHTARPVALVARRSPFGWFGPTIW